VREFQWTLGSSIPNTDWQHQADPEQWNAPFAAEGFSRWRDSLSAKKDTIKRSGDLWTLDTTASGNFIREAWIVVRGGDFHPTEQHILFADDRRLDFEELAFDVAEDQTAATQALEAQNVRQQPPAIREQQLAQPAIDLNEVEFEIRYAMFQEAWDLV